MMTQTQEDGYVECTECGHPIEQHDIKGCDVCQDGIDGGYSLLPCPVMTDPGMALIAAECKSQGGLMEIELERLRNVLGKKKLGKWVLGDIAETLSTSDLGYFPEWVLDPDRNTEIRQWQKVWIYRRDGGLRARVIDAVLRPDTVDVRAVLSEELSSLTAEEKVARILEIAKA